MGLQKIERVNVADLVFDQMKQMLLSGRWKTGDKIPGENVLAQQFGVSRVSVRDAIHRMIGAGVLVAKHGDGTYVADPIVGNMQTQVVQQLLLSTPKLVEVLQLRKTIEVGAIELAASNASEEDVAWLKKLEQEILNCNDIKSFAKKDLEYHNAIAVISKNSLLVRIISIVQDVYSTAMEEAILLRGMESGRFNHSHLTNAIAQHAPVLAKQLMEKHIQDVIDLVN